MIRLVTVLLACVVALAVFTTAAQARKTQLPGGQSKHIRAGTGIDVVVGGERARELRRTWSGRGRVTCFTLSLTFHEDCSLVYYRRTHTLHNYMRRSATVYTWPAS